MPTIAMELGNAEAMKRLVEAGVGVTSAVTVKTEVRAKAARTLAPRRSPATPGGPPVSPWEGPARARR